MMQNRRLPILLLLAATISSGCAIVQSTPADRSTAAVGLAYMLPKALLPIELVETSAGALVLRVKAAELVGDPGQRFLLHAPPNAFSTDDVTIEVDPVTGLLKQVTASSEDQSLASLKELVAAARGIRRAEAAAQGDTVLYAGYFDPDGGPANQDAAKRNAQTLAALQQALQHHVARWQKDCEPVVTTGKPDASRCDADKESAVQRLLPRGAAGVAAVSLEVMPLSPSVAATNGGNESEPARPAPDCSVGLCHRAVQPFQVNLAIPGVFAQSTVVQLPNQGQVLALPLDRAPFVKTEHTVVLSNGIVQSHHAKRPSSALQLVKWPLDVYQAALEATSTLIQLRIGANTNEVDQAQSELDTAKALQRIREELEALRNKQGPELAPLGGLAQGGQLVQELGRSKKASTTGGTTDAGAATPATPKLPGGQAACQSGQPGQACQPAK